MFLKIGLLLICIFIFILYLFKDKIISVIRGENSDCHQVIDLQNESCDIIDDYYETSPN